MCSMENLSVHTMYVRTYAHTAYRFAFQYNVSNSFRNIPNCSCGHGGCSAAIAYVSGNAPSAALLAPSLVSLSLSVAWRNDNSSGSRTLSLLFQCDLSPTWGYIQQRCSLCRCRLLCESIPKLWANTSLTLAPQCFAFT